MTLTLNENSNNSDTISGSARNFRACLYGILLDAATICNLLITGERKK